MDNFVITIARQYGSGGRTVGEMLAKKLGIGYYDKDIIRMASEDSGIHETLFGRVDEYSSAKKPLFGKNGIYSGELISPQSKDFTSDELIAHWKSLVEKYPIYWEGILRDHRKMLQLYFEGLSKCASCIYPR